LFLKKKSKRIEKKKRLSHCEKCLTAAIFKFYKKGSLKGKILIMDSIKTRITADKKRKE
tara:strand:- start:297 stop:473 length:177 start_codon:yes stop_codon:yes gene_type:complete